jgi:hypothetical protein
MKPDFTLHPDGSFTINFSGLSVAMAYPSMDGQPIKPLRVEVAQCRVIYHLTQGTVEIVVEETDTGWCFKSTLRGMSESPHWFHPLAGARLHGVHRLFRTGLGFSGPTGFLAPGEMDSHLVTGLLTAGGATLVVSARDTTRFVQTCHVDQHTHRWNFRNRAIERETLLFEAGFRTERIPISASGLELPTLHFTGSANAAEALRAEATRIGAVMRARTHQPRSYSYCTWYYRGPYYERRDLDALLAGLRTDPQPLTTIQIDDGYSPFQGDWLDHNERWPGGLAAAFAAIRDAGFTPGIWVAPFMVGSRSRVAREHPDWLLQWADGSRVTEWRHYDGSKLEEEHYVLDISHPAAREYLKTVFATLHAWGARMFKIDFLEWGHKDSTLVRRRVPGRTSQEWFRDAVSLIRETVGEESRILGCITFFAPCIGLVDAMRVSSDVGPDWGSRDTGPDGSIGGIPNSIEELAGCHWFNGLWWENDPDVIFLRGFHTRLELGEMEAFALWCGMVGGSVNTSCPFEKLTPEQRALWRFLRPGHADVPASLPGWDRMAPVRTVVRAFPGRKAWAILLLNDGSQPLLARHRVSEWIGEREVALFRWSVGRCEPLGQQQEWISELPAHRAELLYASLDGTPPPADVGLGATLPPASHGKLTLK